jgi:cyclopropane-fatty-acyl-phospholipid synthase
MADGSTPMALPEPGLLSRLLAGMGRPSNISLRLALWNGFDHDLGPSPRVTVRLPGPTALRYFMPPSLDSLAEGYVNGHFDVLGSAADIVDTASRLAHAGVPMRGRFGRLLNKVRHSRDKDASAIKHHYDVSNAFYQLWLDEQMVYSCAYFPKCNETLADAQTAKLDLVLSKIMLKPGERLLDIGCGWGALALRAAQKYGAHVVGVTLSKSQYELARQRVVQLGLQSQVDVRLLDYRDLDPHQEQFDKITSIGMFEHVGLDHLPEYFCKIHALLKDGGLVLNHGITSTDPQSGSSPLGAAHFIEKYVFPNGELPHISLALRDMQAAGLEPLDVESLRRHYARTLTLWAHNYERHSEAIRTMVDETTFRVWRVYLAGCAHAFEQNWVSLHQVLACKAGVGDFLNPTPWSRAYMYS